MCAAGGEGGDTQADRSFAWQLEAARVFRVKNRRPSLLPLYERIMNRCGRQYRRGCGDVKRPALRSRTDRNLSKLLNSLAEGHFLCLGHLLSATLQPVPSFSRRRFAPVRSYPAAETFVRILKKGYGHDES